MKLASLNDGSRDGALVVVSRDLTRFTSAVTIAPNLQAALDDWHRSEPALAALFADLQSGKISGQPFDQAAAHSPLPRAFQWADGSAYVRAARSAGPRGKLALSLAREASAEGAPLHCTCGPRVRG